MKADFFQRVGDGFTTRSFLMIQTFLKINQVVLILICTFVPNLGLTTIRTGQAQDANAILIPKEDADEAMDCASCIGCGACVAACKNGSAMLFVSSKVSQLALLPQGRVEAARRAKAMVMAMEEAGFGNCTNTRACEAVCPKNETIANIARLNREFIKAKLAD